MTVNVSFIEQQIISHESMLKTIIQANDFLNKGNNRSAIATYLTDYKGYMSSIPLETAIINLNKQSWNALINSTGIADVMPEKRRSEWRDQEKWIEFNEDNVKSTLLALLKEQGLFTAEKVDGIFRGLSKSHVTNQPQGFYKRCIFTLSSRKGEIHDLRFVIAKLVGRDTKVFTYYDTDRMLDRVATDGQWVEVDGGAFKIRRYQVGTAHIEFHPDIAWQLNSILATIHGEAIPESFKRKPEKEKKKIKEVALIDDLIPFEVINLFHNIRQAYELIGNSYNGRRVAIKNTFDCSHHQKDKYLVARFDSVMTLLGGICKHGYRWQFEYDARDVIDHVITHGTVPNQKSHQFYPTNNFLALEASLWAEIKDEDTVLEPSAGQGAIAAHLPQERTTLVEVSELQCEILKAKGFSDVVNDDFIKFAEKTEKKFSVCVMNPPFSENRALLHLTTAASLLEDGGRLVAILPSSAVNYDFPVGFEVELSTIRKNQFKGTSVSVVMVKLTKI
ncbi:DUF4942 domain-containing protein [Vibrio sp. S11_S32]|uniref:DUF4942 domain-containing protein n=1 Tax=Vibrio sp. S11_S32 TaxID=2720225 RepID=UPI0016804AED|nr:DUF4942 domain-containing protein [Vibrio sp. S11_S32]MBD1577943.1 DUF4942 domain-containing protein [Vibrio sp. S11_S32]